MYKVKVFVTLRESILDPEGAAVKGALHKLGFGHVSDVRMGKVIEMTVASREGIDEMCETLLVNTVMEDYTYEIEEMQP